MLEHVGCRMVGVAGRLDCNVGVGGGQDEGVRGRDRDQPVFCQLLNMFIGSSGRFQYGVQVRQRVFAGEQIVQYISLFAAKTAPAITLLIPGINPPLILIAIRFLFFFILINNF